MSEKWDSTLEPEQVALMTECTGLMPALPEEPPRPDKDARHSRRRAKKK